VFGAVKGLRPKVNGRSNTGNLDAHTNGTRYEGECFRGQAISKAQTHAFLTFILPLNNDNVASKDEKLSNNFGVFADSFQSAVLGDNQGEKMKTDDKHLPNYLKF
jgi:hypothetical protein